MGSSGANGMAGGGWRVGGALRGGVGSGYWRWEEGRGDEAHGSTRCWRKAVLVSDCLHVQPQPSQARCTLLSSHESMRGEQQRTVGLHHQLRQLHRDLRHRRQRRILDDTSNAANNNMHTGYRSQHVGTVCMPALPPAPSHPTQALL